MKFSSAMKTENHDTCRRMGGADITLHKKLKRKDNCCTLSHVHAPVWIRSGELAELTALQGIQHLSYCY